MSHLNSLRRVAVVVAGLVVGVAALAMCCYPATSGKAGHNFSFASETDTSCLSRTF